MFRIFLQKSNFVITDLTEKEFKIKYLGSYEQIGIFKELDNLEIAIEKLIKTYNPEDIIHDYHVKKKWGWKYFTEEQREDYRKRISESLKLYKKTDEHKKNLSDSCKSLRNHKGKKHTSLTKARIAFTRRGQDPIKGRKWMHNPYSGKESRGYELKPGMIWGRSPEASEYVLEARQRKKYKNQRAY